MPMTKQPLRNQHGLTLIELMISITIGLFVLSGVVYMLTATMRTNTNTLRTTHLNQELRSIMQTMSRDLKRAGYVGSPGNGTGNGAENLALCASMSSLSLSATSGTFTFDKPTGNKACDYVTIEAGSTLMNMVKSAGVVTASCANVTGVSGSTVTASNAACPGAGSANAFSSSSVDQGTWTIINPFTTITAEDVASDADAGDDCMLLSYDEDDDGTIDVGERFGFRFDAVNGTIEAGTNVTSCTAGTWESLSDDADVEITDLDIVGTSFTNATATVDVCVREIQLLLSGRMRSDNTVTREIEESVRMRNDLIIESACPTI